MMDASEYCRYLRNVRKEIATDKSTAEVLEFLVHLVESLLPEWSVRIEHADRQELIACYFDSSFNQLETSVNALCIVLKRTTGSRFGRAFVRCSMIAADKLAARECCQLFSRLVDDNVYAEVFLQLCGSKTKASAADLRGWRELVDSLLAVPARAANLLGRACPEQLDPSTHQLALSRGIVLAIDRRCDDTMFALAG
jgi:hypothetical protein